MSMKKFIIPFAFLLAIIICVAVPVGVTASVDTSASGDEAVAIAKLETPTSAVEPATEPRIIPGEVKGIKASEVDSDTLLLTWDKSEFATMYTIYRADETEDGKIGEYEKYKNVKSNMFRDTGLSEARIYKYQIFAYRITDNYIAQSKPADISVMTKLENIDSVTISEKTTSSITVNWSASDKADKYLLYRSDEKEDGTFKPYKKIREFDKDSGRSFTDKNLIGGTVYKYKVICKRTEGGNSAVSAGKAVKAMTDISAPKHFKKLKATETAIKLGWDSVIHARKYELYRDGVKIKTLKDTTYTDRGLLSGSLHNYTVKALRKVGKSVRVGNSAYLNAACKLPGDRIVVSISNQNLKVYKNNKVVYSTAVITGAPGDRATTVGHHHIISRKSPAILKGSYGGSSWTTRVSYWMGFTYSGQGIHDATWQSAFGGQYYRQGRGSHGCVNVSLSSAKKIYDNCHAGELVIVKN